MIVIVTAEMSVNVTSTDLVSESLGPRLAVAEHATLVGGDPLAFNDMNARARAAATARVCPTDSRYGIVIQCHDNGIVWY